MRVAIISQGPETAKLFPKQFQYMDEYYYRHIIGVNQNLGRQAVGWWCFADYTAFAQIVASDHYPPAHPFCTPLHIFTKHDITSELANDADCAHALSEWQRVKKRAIFQADLRPLPPMQETPWKRMKYSGLYALWLAWHLEATEVDCYGVDLGGDKDFLGQRNDSRNPPRWKRERTMWYTMCQALEGAGVTICMARMASWRAAQEMHELKTGE